MFVKTLNFIVGAILVFFVSTASARDSRLLGFQLPPGVEDPRPCPEGTTKVQGFAGPGYEQLCVKFNLLGVAIKHGPCMVWYAKGNQKYIEGAYREGKPHGPWTFWHENGQKERQGLYQEGEPEGIWVLWGEDGQKVEVEFRNGEAVKFSPSLEIVLALRGFALGSGGHSRNTAPLLYRGKEIQGQIIDAMTEKPIAKAVVVALWTLSNESMVNPGDVRLHVSESITDENGRYIFPEWHTLRPPLTSSIFSIAPTLTVLKSGYRPSVVFNETTQMAPPPVADSDWNGKVIKLEQATGNLEEQAASWSKAYGSLSVNREDFDPNHWKHFPQATRETHKEEQRLRTLGLSPRQRIIDLNLLNLDEKDREFLWRFE